MAEVEEKKAEERRGDRPGRDNRGGGWRPGGDRGGERGERGSGDRSGDRGASSAGAADFALAASGEAKGRPRSNWTNSSATACIWTIRRTSW
jgi:hypothetical protein